MKRSIVGILCLMGMVSFAGHALAIEGKESFARYTEIRNRQDIDENERAKMARAYVQALDKKSFHAFVEEFVRQPKFKPDVWDWQVPVFGLARIYLDGPGKGESAAELASYLKDGERSPLWRMALLDAARLHDRGDLSSSDAIAVFEAMMHVWQNEKEPEGIRVVTMKAANRIVLAEIAAVGALEPSIKQRVMSRDSREFQLMARQEAIAPEVRKRLVGLAEMSLQYEDALRRVTENGAQGRVKDVARTLLSEATTRPVSVPPGER